MAQALAPAPVEMAHVEIEANDEALNRDALGQLKSSVNYENRIPDIWAHVLAIATAHRRHWQPSARLGSRRCDTGTRRWGPSTGQRALKTSTAGSRGRLQRRGNQARGAAQAMESRGAAGALNIHQGNPYDEIKYDLRCDLQIRERSHPRYPSIGCRPAAARPIGRARLRQSCRGLGRLRVITAGRRGFRGPRARRRLFPERGSEMRSSNGGRIAHDLKVFRWQAVKFLEKSEADSDYKLKNGGLYIREWSERAVEKRNSQNSETGSKKGFPRLS